MEIKNYFAQNAQGDILPGAQVDVFFPGTLTHVPTLQNAEGGAKANPFFADTKGLIQFAAPDGFYDMKVTAGAASYVLRIQCVDLEDKVSEAEAFSDAAESFAAQAETARDVAVSTYADLQNDTDPTKGAALVGRASVTVESLAELAGLPVDKKITAHLDLNGRSGTFVFSSQDLSAEVTADPLQGVYVAPTADATGATGAWVRLYDKAIGIDVAWFGADNTGTTDATAETKAALAVAGLSGETVTWSGDLRISETIDMRDYCSRVQVSAVNNYVESMVSIVTDTNSRILWYGGKDLDGRYGTCIIALSRFTAFGDTAPSGEGTYYTGTLSGFQIIAPEVPAGHAGGWPITNRFTTTASAVGGCTLPDQATYPVLPITKTTLPDYGLPVPDGLASCGIYAELLGKGLIERTQQERLAYGAYIGIGYGFSFRNNAARWCNCGIRFGGAVTGGDVSVNTYERNAVGMLFSISSTIHIFKNTVQANYAGADIVLHSNNHGLTFEENYFEVSPRCFVVRTDSTGNFRNSNVRLIRNHSLGLDLDTQAIDKMLIEENSIRFVGGVPDTNIRGLFGASDDTCQIIVRDNTIPDEAGASGERRTLFTQWAGTDLKRVYARDTLRSAAALPETYFGRFSQVAIRRNIAAPADAVIVRVPNQACSGIIKVQVTKNRLTTAMRGEYLIYFNRAAGSAVATILSTPVSTSLTTSGTPETLSPLAVVVVTGAAAADNFIALRENGAAGSNSAFTYFSAEMTVTHGSAFMYAT